MDDQIGIARQLADSVERLIEDRLDRARLTAAENGEFPEDLWQAFSDLGLSDALVPADQDGAGLGWRELAPALARLGAGSVPVPAGENAVARGLLACTGAAPPDGLIALPTRPAAPLGRAADGTVSGILPKVLWAPRAEFVLAECDGPEGPQLALLPRMGLPHSPSHALSREPHETLTVTDAKPHLCVGTSRGTLLLAGALLRALQIRGAIVAALATTVDYAGVRTQFGRPIGRFQAIQQLLAEMANEAAAANAVCEMAVCAADRGEWGLQIAVAKARCSAAADRGTAIAHEVHAAIGVTEDLALHYLTRRLWQWRDDFGDASYWHDALGRKALAAPANGLWSLIKSASGAAGCDVPAGLA
ncbi:MAG: acyl-CoA/acyl-ACP dehydrogenase [Alphaproteobacteria bacterium]|nr:acyl-CoA/acyl-ACP dehydrogenase [Alphaproteobacteria bacterium]